MSHARLERRVIGGLVVLSLCSATPAFTCSVVRSPDGLEMLLSADAIARARPVEYVGPRPDEGEVRWLADGRFAFELRFDVIEVLHGQVPETIELDGKFVADDDFNNAEIPYHFVRPAGRGGNCWAYEYKAGAEYLLFLKRVDDEFTIGWYALGPVNEQITGPNDPWLAWTRQTLETYANFLGSEVRFPWAPYAFLLGTWRGEVGPDHDRQQGVRSFMLGAEGRHLVEHSVTGRQPNGLAEKSGIWSYDRTAHSVLYRELGTYGRSTNYSCRLEASDTVVCTEDRPESHWVRTQLLFRPHPGGGWTEFVESIVREEGVKRVGETRWLPADRTWAEGVWKTCYEAGLKDVLEIDDGYLLLLPNGRYLEYSLGCCPEKGSAPYLYEGSYWISEDGVTLQPRTLDQNRATARVLGRLRGKAVFFDDLERPRDVLALSSGDDLNYAWCKTFSTDAVE